MPLALYVSPSIAIQELTRADHGWRGENAWEWTVESEWLEFRSSERDSVGRILGNTYDRFAIRTSTYFRRSVDDGNLLFRIPSLEVIAERDGEVFNEYGLSSAEYWLAYCTWILRTRPHGIDVVIFDEVETSMSPSGHVAFVDEIARLTIASGVQTIVITHSEAILERIPPALLRVALPANGKSEIRTVDDPADVVRVLGYPARSVRAVAFVEDHSAKTILIALVARLAPGLLECVEIVASGGRDRALLAASVTSNSQRLVSLAVLDGDQRPSPASSASESAHRLYLPGGHPEIDILAAVESNLEDVAIQLGVTSTRLSMALQARNHLPHQQWFEAIAKALHTSADLVWHLAVQAWLLDTGVKEQASDLVRMITRRIESPQ